MERWDAYDGEGRLTGRELIRGLPVPDGLYHLVCTILVRHVDGTFLITLRDSQKPSMPGVYEVSCGGSAVKGETGEQAARRELWEETGIRAGALTRLYRVKGEHTFYEGYLCITDIAKDDVVLQPGETAEYCWLTAQELKTMIREQPQAVVVRDGVLAYLERV